MAFIAELTGYELEPLRDDGEFALYRAQQPSNPVPVLALVATRPASRTIARLENEYALEPVLDPSWAARPLALQRDKGPTTLLLEDNGGDPLDRALGRPLELTRFLRLAINLATAVGQVHRHGLIHKDIKPANLLVDDAGTVRLTGFGIASRLPHERQQPAPPETIAGTFAYMAPEQTGRMNRSTDARSDLYSLGVTLYEMLTGALPFTASDPMEWIHCHIARRPTPPSQRVSGIPAPIDAIILKLLAKTAEDRYQTAAGVAADLRRCLDEWEETGGIEAFPLGAHDVPDVLRIPEKLYGREEQVGSLLAAFDRVVSRGTPELVLVSGYSGIGKSSVVHELHKAIVPPRGLFASGKFDQYRRDIPYATLAQAFQNLVHQIIVKSDAEVDHWRRALTEAVGPNGQLIVNLIPELELIIGKQPPVPDLPPQDAQNRFRMVFRRFLGVFARPEHPLALFLDDLQWLDAATIELLELLITDPDVRHVLLVGAYRDNEVGPSHPLTRTLELIRKANARVQEIVLAPLGLDDIGRLVAEALHRERNAVRPLAQLVHEKTSGNPFFAIQFFTALVEEGMLAFDPGTRVWQWDMNRIQAKSYTDNVVDLMAGKLRRLSAPTQEALKQLACLGNVAEIAVLTLIHGEIEEAMHAALWEAVHAGLIFRSESAYKFLHDRIQQAAYSLIPEEHRGEVHLRIGRALLANMKADELQERLFDVANQFNRGAALLVDRDERARVAMLDLRAGRKAKASAAFASAGLYFAAGMALLDERDWVSQYELAFGLSLERAECEYLSGKHDEAEELISELLARAASKIDKAAAYRLKVDLHVMNSENPKGVETALECLRLFGIEMPAHPTREQVDAEYEKVWNNLGEKPIESLIDLPLMSDPEMQAAMGVLAGLFAPAYFTDINLVRLHLCHMVNVSMKYGTTDASTHAYAWFGTTLGPTCRRYTDGYRFGKLACDLVEKHKFLAYRARTYFSMEMVVLWTQPIATALAYIRAAFRAGVDGGDLNIACFSCNHAITDLLARGDHLDEVSRESERGLDFVRKARFRDVIDIIVSQQRFIENMRGRTASFSTFSDAQFDETAFEAQLTEDRMATMVDWYWILKLQARFISGDYEAAVAAARKAKALLWASDAHIQLLDYYYYAALAVAAVYETAQPDQQREWREVLAAHLQQLREWAEDGAVTFGDKHALVAAEIARLEARELDAMRLYEQAIQSARKHGFVQNEGIAHEVAARFYLARGLNTIGHIYLRNARTCYERWGALGKVKQLERSHPHLLQEPVSPRSDNAIGTPVEHLDLATVVKVSQAVSSEIDLSKLTDRLMVTALEHAGAERGLLILLRGEEPQIEAEATIGRDAIEVRLREARATAAELPQSILQYVMRTGDNLLLDDASDQSPFSADEYIRRNHSRSILCLPLIKQAKLIGILYLENNLASHVFTPARIAVLRLLASQAAISLENARLYTDLRRAEAVLAEAQRLSQTGSFVRRVSSGEIFWSEQTFKIFEYEPATKPTIEMALNRVHPDDVALVQRVIDRAADEKQDFNLEYRLLLPDGSVKYIHAVGHATTDDAGELEFVGAVMDVTAAKRAGEELYQAQAELAHVTRVTALGELTASIAHEVKQPLAALVTSAGAGLRRLASQPPDLEAARRALGRIIRDGHRASEVLDRIRALIRKAPPNKERIDVNEIISETIALTRAEAQRNGISLQTQLANGLPLVAGDRIQLQQVILNLIVNAIEAMSGDGAERRELLVTSAKEDPNGVLVAVRDSGPGLGQEDLNRLFDAFYTTKHHGMGMGLAISRTIIGSHGGRLWASPNMPRGAIFQFNLPIDDEEARPSRQPRSSSKTATMH